MDKGKNPKVVRTWIADRLRKATAKLRTAPKPVHQPERHNKT